MTSDPQQIFRDNLRRRIAERNLTQKDLATSIGVSPSTLNDWVTGKKLPRMDKVDKLCAFFRCTRSDLLDVTRHAQAAVKIPVLGTVVAGIPMETVENIIGYEEVAQAMAAQGELFALRVEEHSMEPRICEGDVVIVRKQLDVESGDIAIVLVDGSRATVKRVKKTEDGITLIANNVDMYAPHFYTNREIQELPVQVIGKVVELRGKL